MPFKIRSNEISGVDPIRFRAGGKLHHRVRIYLEATENDSLEDIRSVQYELHPTFRERIRFSDDAVNQFELRIWTYGYFTIQATLIKDDGSTEAIKGFVKW